LVIKKALIKGLSKNDVRVAGWQIDCEDKAHTYSELL
jgi:hypothetical protein